MVPTDLESGLVRAKWPCIHQSPTLRFLKLKPPLDNANTTLQESVPWNYLMEDVRRNQAEIENITVVQVSDDDPVDVGGQL